jgi:ribosomal-protein-alanine N-acetyltransferase
MELRGDRVRLREFVEEDFETTHVYGSDPEVVRYQAWGPNTPDDTREFIRRARDAAAETPRTTFELAVVEDGAGGGRHVGGCGLMGRRVHYREYEVGYCFARDAWGRGLASEALALLLGMAFDAGGDVRANRIYACIDPLNRASRRVVEKAGFRLEGHQRRDTLLRGEWRDSLIYALLCDEFESGARR